jgi:hypothetical protein
VCLLSHEISRIIKFIETENTTVSARNKKGVGNEKAVFNGCRVSVWDNGKVLRWLVRVGAQQWECALRL